MPNSAVDPSATSKRTGRPALPTAAVAVQTSCCTASRDCSAGTPAAPPPLSPTVISWSDSVTCSTVVPAHGRRYGVALPPVRGSRAAESAAWAFCAAVASPGTVALTNWRNSP